MNATKQRPASPAGYRQSTVDKYRYVLVEYDDWYCDVEADFRETMAERGVHVDRIYFSGFSSQGDGACFEGSVDDWSLFLPAAFPKGEYPLVRKLVAIDKGAVALAWCHSGHYYHENCTVFSLDACEFADVIEDDNPLRRAAAEALDEELDKEYDTFEDDCKSALRGWMRDLYSDLNEEYDCLTSDDAVRDWLWANEIEDNEDE